MRSKSKRKKAGKGFAPASSEAKLYYFIILWRSVKRGNGQKNGEAGGLLRSLYRSGFLCVLKILEHGDNSAAVGLFDVLLDLVGLQSLDQSLDGGVVLVAFLHGDDVGEG